MVCMPVVLHVTIFIGDCLWMELPFIKNCTESLRSVFPVVGYAYTNVSTYPCGQIGFLLAGKDKVFYLITSQLSCKLLESVSIRLCFWHCFSVFVFHHLFSLIVITNYVPRDIVDFKKPALKNDTK